MRLFLLPGNPQVVDNRPGIVTQGLYDPESDYLTTGGAQVPVIREIIVSAWGPGLLGQLCCGVPIHRNCYPALIPSVLNPHAALPAIGVNLNLLSLTSGDNPVPGPARMAALHFHPLSPGSQKSISAFNV